MAALSTQVVTQAGITPTFAAASGGGDTIVPSDTSVLVVTNGDSAPHTVTLDVVTPNTVTGEAYPDHTVTVTNGTTKYIGPLSPSIYRNATTGLCAVTYSAVTSMTVAVIGL